MAILQGREVLWPQLPCATAMLEARTLRAPPHPPTHLTRWWTRPPPPGWLLWTWPGARAAACSACCMRAADVQGHGAHQGQQCLAMARRSCGSVLRMLHARSGRPGPWSTPGTAVLAPKRQAWQSTDTPSLGAPLRQAGWRHPDCSPRCAKLGRS